VNETQVINSILKNVVNSSISDELNKPVPVNNKPVPVNNKPAPINNFNNRKLVNDLTEEVLDELMTDEIQRANIPKISRSSLMNRVNSSVRALPYKIGWKKAIREANSDVELTRLEKLLNNKIQLRTNIEKANLGPIVRKGHMSKVMQMKNNVNARRALVKSQNKSTNLAGAKMKLINKARETIRGPGGMIGKWKPRIEDATNANNLANLEAKLNEKAKLRNEIMNADAKKFRFRQKQQLLSAVMKLEDDAKVTRNAFERRLRVDDIKKFINTLTIPKKNKDAYIKQLDTPNANLNLIKASAEKQANLNGGQAATKIQAAFKGKKNRNTVLEMKKEEFRKLAKNAANNFSSDINAMKNMKNAFKLRGRIEGSILKKRTRTNPLFENDKLVKPRMNTDTGFKVYNVPTNKMPNATPGMKKMNVNRSTFGKTLTMKEQKNLNNRRVAEERRKQEMIEKQKASEASRNLKANLNFNKRLAEKRRLLMEKKAKSEPKKRKSKK